MGSSGEDDWTVLMWQEVAGELCSLGWDLVRIDLEICCLRIGGGRASLFFWS